MTATKTKFELLIFDLDGTLVDTRKDLTAAVNYTLRSLGEAQLDVKTVTEFVGNGITQLLERILKQPEPERLNRGKAFFSQYYSAHLADDTQPYPGIIEVLDYFSNRKKALITNKSQEFTIPLLLQLNMDRYFDLVIGAHSGYKAKPDPEAIFAILKQLQVMAQNTVIIGDSGNDIRAGKAAGISTCAVTYGYRRPEALLALCPDFVANDPLELLQLFGQE